MLKRSIAQIMVLLIVVVGISGCAELEETPALKARHLVNQAAETIDRFRTLEGLQDFAKHIPEAHALVIFPSLIKAGFMVAGEAGSGVLIARDGTGSWGQPSFYTLGAASFRGQLGIQDTEVILVIRNPGALQSIIEHQGKIGADAGVTVGIYGVGVEASTTSNLDADVVAFANSRLGAFMGMSLEGAVMVTRHDFNEAYYKPGATPQSILAGQNSSPTSDHLIKTLDK